MGSAWVGCIAVNSEFLEMISCCIFDLDGVLVDTARYHFEAWRELAHGLGFEFTPEDGELTKGVSRMASLDIVLRCGGMADRFSEEEKLRMASAKNARYLELVGRMTRSEVLAGAEALLEDLRGQGIKVVLGSASKNTRVILGLCGLTDKFDQVVDGTMISRAKPDPEVFSRGAELAGIDPAECIVFEDAAAGVEAARRAGMRSVGVGRNEALSGATIRVDSLEGLTYSKLLKLFEE